MAYCRCHGVLAVEVTDGESCLCHTPTQAELDQFFRDEPCGPGQGPTLFQAATGVAESSPQPI